MTDALWRIGLRVAYRLLRCWWWLRRPETHGAYVAVWRGDALLLIRNSYRSGESVPAGMIRRGEPPVEAAARELREEVGIRAPLDDLVDAGVHVVDFEDKRDHAHFFELQVDSRIEPQIDRREVVKAEFVALESLDSRPLMPHTRAYLSARSQSAS